MADHETETRVRFRHTGEPDSTRYVHDPRAAGEAFREKRDEIARSGRGGGVEIGTRQVGPRVGVPEKKAVIAPAKEA